MKKLYFILLISSIGTSAQFGGLDVTFGNQGKVYSSFSTSTNEIRNIIVLPGDKILTGGTSFRSATKQDFTLSRYNTDGTLDVTFGTLGKIIVDYGSVPNQLTSMCLLSTGKILTAGNVFYSATSTGDALFIQFNLDGTIDTSFGNNGFLTYDFGGQDTIYGIKQLPNGKIVAVGDNQSSLLVAQYLPGTMTLDTSFNTTGYYMTAVNGFNLHVNDVSNSVDGKIVISGYTYSQTSLQDFTVWKFNNDGSPDINFGNGGKVTTDFFGNNDTPSDMKILTDGKIILSGSSRNPTEQFNRFSLAKYNPDGTPDSLFGLGGKKTYLNDPTLHEGAPMLCLRSNGKLIMAGTVYSIANINAQNNLLTLFLNADGSPDSSFGTNGWIATDFSGRDSNYAIAEQSDGKIILAGKTQYTTSTTEGIMARLTVETALGTNFFSELCPIRIYPNPVENQLYIDFNFNSPEIVSFSIFDNRGRIIGTKSTNTFIEVYKQTVCIDNLGDLSEGIYFLKVQSGASSQVFKIIKS